MDNMTEEEQKLSKEAADHVKANKRELIERFASLDRYLPDERPVSVFMAGSPGAGKTEFSKRLLETFSNQAVRIDADEVRAWIPDKTRGDANIYQKASTDGAQKLYDHALHKNLNAVLDGTFAYVKAIENVKRSLDYNRRVEIYFLYQDPLVSWRFTKDREKMDRRNVPQEVFIRAFIDSMSNVGSVKAQFGKQVVLNVVVKDYSKSLDLLRLNVDNLEKHLPRRYTKVELEQMLNDY